MDLIKKEDITDETLAQYIEVLDRQSARLKKLIEDLIEASKASTGNIEVNLDKININVFMEQIIGEYNDEIVKNNLKYIYKCDASDPQALADVKILWRVLDNILANACKYAMENSRMYITVGEDARQISIEVKNISKEELNITGDELMESFVRGDSSRNTEGSGLGLSISRSLMSVQGGNLKIHIDGDLFKVVLLLLRA